MNVFIINNLLTHIKLSNKATHVIVFVIKRQQLVPKLCLILYMEAVARLQWKKKNHNDTLIASINSNQHTATTLTIRKKDHNLTYSLYVKRKWNTYHLLDSNKLSGPFLDRSPFSTIYSKMLAHWPHFQLTAAFSLRCQNVYGSYNSRFTLENFLTLQTHFTYYTSCHHIEISHSQYYYLPPPKFQHENP